MNFDFDDEQRLVVESTATLLGRFAGPDRARALDGGYDEVLESELDKAGYLEFDMTSSANRLDAALVVEQIAAYLGCLPAGSRLLLGNLLGRPGRITACQAESAGMVRYAGSADFVVLVGDGRAQVIEAADAEITPQPSIFGFPYASVHSSRPAAVLAVPEAATAWQVGTASELVGLMSAALQRTVDYLTQRHQFGKPIASFQAVRHRLAEARMMLEASRALTRYAAYIWTAEAATVAAAYTVKSAELVARECHQLSGAIGFTDEYDLHLYTLRLHALRRELGGQPVVNLAVANARWPRVAAS